MPSYTYVARDSLGKKVKGEIEADNEKDVISKLRTSKLTVISIKKRSELAKLGKKELSGITIFPPRIKSRDIIVAFRQFATLINAGVPVVQAIGVLANQTHSSSFKKILNKVRSDVEAGVYLSDALSYHPKIFSPFICNLIKAGEAGGVLDEILLRLANYLEQRENIKNRIKGALRYPIFVLFMAGGLSLALIFFVLPRMEELFRESFNIELPAFTLFVLNSSRVLREKFYIIPLVVGIAYLVYILLKKSDRGQYWIDSLKLKIPVLGRLFHQIAISRFARTLATLTSSGVPILDALDLTAKAAGNKVIQVATEDAKEALRKGETIASPLKKYPVFPPLTVNMISVGEETGALDDMLNKIADLYEEEVNRMVDSLASLIEPILIVLLGGTVGVIVVAMYLPYFTMFQHIGG